MRTWTMCTAIALLSCGALPERAVAQTGTAAEVEQLYAEGAALYRAGKYRAAIAKFEAAYALYPEPNLQYNLGRAHEALGELGPAIAAYRRCASSPEVSAETKAKAEEKAAMLDGVRAKAAAAAPDVARAPPAPAATARTAPPPRDGTSGLRVAGWVAGGVGVALAVTGAVFFGLGASDHAEVSRAANDAGDGVADLTRVEAQARLDDGERNKTIGVGLLGGAAAAGVGALVLFLIDGGDDASTLGVAPTAEGGAAVSFGGTF